MKTIKPRVKLMDTRKVSSVRAPVKRITGNSLYGLMRRFERDNPRLCAECKRNGFVSYGEELDHIVPLHLGGGNNKENLQWLCHAHHLEKSEREAQDRGRGVSQSKTA